MKLVRIFLDILFPPRKMEHVVRSLSIEEVTELLAPVQVQPLVTSLLPYRTESVSALVQEAKFKNNAKAQQLLGACLAKYLQDAGLTHTTVIPIPLSQTRHKERGYNQVEQVLKAGNIPYTPHVLVRTRDTKPQTSLGAKERRTNLQDAFEVQAALLPNHTYIVVDDVTTTGATIFSAMEVLKSAGALEVRAITLAH
ncbi:hypothetical protein KKD81_02555 [Patescibacteria group bacterium]|nr:hypothetical protein [Patescibacteria group bacterium]MBU2220795.1 hypothetical protein [Patescibacteria group bacterium]